MLYNIFSDYRISDSLRNFGALGKIGAGVVPEPNDTDKGCKILASLRASRFRL